MRLFGPMLAVLCALAVLLVPAQAAACPTCIDPTYHVDERDAEHVIPLGWRNNWDPPRECGQRDSCEHLEGVAFATVDISDDLADYEDGDYAWFELENELPTQTLTLWVVVTYDEQGDIIEGHFDDKSGWGFSGELQGHEHEMRLFPVQSSPNEFDLDVSTYP